MTTRTKVNDKLVTANGPKVITAFEVNGTVIDDRFDAQTETVRTRIEHGRKRKTIHEY